MPIVKTEAGHQALKDRSVPLTPRQRTALILLDGKRTPEEVLSAATATLEDLERLIELGLVEESRPAPKAAAPRPAAADPSDRYLRAYQAAVRLTAELGLKGVRLNLAVEAARDYAQLAALMPRLQAALRPERFAELEALMAG